MRSVHVLTRRGCDSGRREDAMVLKHLGGGSGEWEWCVCVCLLLFFDVALDLLKRYSGIVWDPGRFRGIAPRRGREEVGEPCGRTRPNPHALAIQIPLSKV